MADMYIRKTCFGHLSKEKEYKLAIRYYDSYEPPTWITVCYLTRELADEIVKASDGKVSYWMDSDKPKHPSDGLDINKTCLLGQLKDLLFEATELEKLNRQAKIEIDMTAERVKRLTVVSAEIEELQAKINGQ